MENLDRLLVIDADGHVNEGDVDLSSRLPDKWRSQAPVRLKDNQGYPRILLEGRLWSASQGPGPGVTGPFTAKARKSRPERGRKGSNSLLALLGFFVDLWRPSSYLPIHPPSTSRKIKRVSCLQIPRA
ncbi:MAG: hypothetical protein HYY46_24965 [Deltaproteobacteria bacterium]|nr:hypothetical protein [Deltaproteobacteria bacterium]